MNVFSNVILARTRQLPDDDRMIEICRSIFKSFNVNNLSVCIGWCADQVTEYPVSARKQQHAAVEEMDNREQERKSEGSYCTTNFSTFFPLVYGYIQGYRKRWTGFETAIT